MTDRPDSSRTPTRPPHGANGPTPSRILDRNNNFVPINSTPVSNTYGRQAGNFREFAARHSQGLSPPRLRRSGPQHTAVWHDLHTGFTPEGGLVDSPSQQESPPRLVLSPSQYNEALSNPESAPIRLLEDIERDLDNQIRDLQAVIRNNQEQLLRTRHHHRIVTGIIRNANGRVRTQHGIRARSPLTQEDNFVEGRIFHEYRTPANTPVPVRTPDVRRRGRGRQRRYSLDGTRRRFLEEKDQIKF